MYKINLNLCWSRCSDLCLAFVYVCTWFILAQKPEMYRCVCPKEYLEGKVPLMSSLIEPTFAFESRANYEYMYVCMYIYIT